MTGIFLDLPELSGKQVGLLKEIVPRLSRIAIFGIPGLNAAQFAATETAVRALALEAEIMEVRVADDFEQALEAARTRHVEAGILLSSPLVYDRSKQIGELALAKRLPLISLFAEFPKSGGLIAYRAERRRDVPKMRGLRRENPARCQAKRLTDTAARRIRSGDQPQDRHGTRP